MFIDNVVIDGTAEDSSFQGDGQDPPFALFSPDLQENIGGPYATREHAEQALALMKAGVISPFIGNVISSAQWERGNQHE